MRIIAVTDTHQNTLLLQRSVRQAIEDGPIGAFLHCGDGVRDLDCVEQELLQTNPSVQIYAVRGNCDLGAFEYPETELADFYGVRALITHGHLYSVKHGLGKLAKAAKEQNAQLAFFGHTHIAAIEEKHGVTLINPGSLASWHQGGTAYLEVTITADGIVREKFIRQRGSSR